MVIVVLEKIPNVWVSRSPLFRKKRLMLDEKFQVVKCFKMCHILYIRKPQVTYSIFHFTLLYFSPNECPGLCWHRPGARAFIRGKNKVAKNEKQKKQLCVFVYIKYGKFWSVSLELFIKHIGTSFSWRVNSYNLKIHYHHFICFILKAQFMKYFSFTNLV